MAKDTAVAAYQVRHRHRPAPPSSPRVLAVLHGLATVLVPSRFNIAVDLPDDRKAVYNTFAASMTVMPTAVWARCLGPGARRPVTGDAVPPVLGDLQSRGFLVPEETDEMALLRQHYLAARHDGAARLTVNILPTLGCNLECTYCFQGKTQASSHPRLMAAETQDAVVAFLGAEAAARKGLAVSWFGGEPLLALRTIGRMSRRLIDACAKAKGSYSSVLTTNGVLLDPAAVEALVAAEVTTLQVTVDVPAANKHDKRGRGTRDLVLDNTAGAAERMSVHMRINMTCDDRAEWDDLFAALVARGLHKRLKSVSIANVFQPEHARCDGVASTVAHRDYVDVNRRQRLLALEAGLPMNPALSWKCPNGCAATSEATTTIDPEGLLYKCPEDAGRPDRAYGSVFLAQPLRPGNLTPWLDYDWFKHEDCRDCPVLPQCAGGCAHRRLFQPDLNPDDFCYWFLRGDLHGRIRELAQSHLTPA